MSGGKWRGPKRQAPPAFRSRHLQALDITRFQTISNYIPAGRPILRFHSFQLDVERNHRFSFRRGYGVYRRHAVFLQRSSPAFRSKHLQPLDITAATIAALSAEPSPSMS